MTTMPPVSIADVIRKFAPRYMATRGASPAQQHVLHALCACRTAALGGHVLECGDCGERKIAYNSCRNRHCPACLNHKSRAWLDGRCADLLPVRYFHVVFTIPEVIASLALGNKKVVYDILFAASAQTLQEVARDPRHLGADIGFLSVLHTWDQRLRHHPHVHCVVPGGGLSPDESRWVDTRGDFFLPVRVLSRVFRGKFLSKLIDAFESNALRFAGSTKIYETAIGFRELVRISRTTDWVVYAKAPFGSPEQVLKYLARYTHKVAISNARIHAIQADHVLFRYRANAATNTYGTMRLDGVEFIRRFLQHVLPKGYTRIRAFGLLANCHKKRKLERCRQLLGVEPPPPETSADETTDDDAGTPDCPNCGQQMLVIDELQPIDVDFFQPQGRTGFGRAPKGSP